MYPCIAIAFGASLNPSLLVVNQNLATRYTRNVESSHLKGSSSSYFHPKIKFWTKLKTSKTHPFGCQNRKYGVDSESVRKTPEVIHFYQHNTFYIHPPWVSGILDPLGTTFIRGPSEVHPRSIWGSSGVHLGPIRGPGSI